MTAEPDPPSQAACFRLATTYLARRAASKLQLRRYLLRKLGRQRADSEVTDGSTETVIDAVLDRLEHLQLIDETSLAQSRARTLTRKGYSGRRLRTHLAHQGFDLTSAAVAPFLDVDDEAQALRYAERKRLGIFAVSARKPSFERDVRALVRAGFATDLAIRVMRRLQSKAPNGPPNDAPDMNEP